MRELDRGSFKIVKEERKPIRLVSDGDQQVLTVIGDSDQFDLGQLVPEVSLSGRVVARRASKPDDLPSRYYLVPAVSQIATNCNGSYDTLITDCPESWIILDTKGIAGDYLTLKIDGNDVKDAEKDEIAIIVIQFNANILIFNSYEDYDRWIAIRRLDFTEGRSKTDVSENNSGVPAPIYHADTKKYDFPTDAFAKLTVKLANVDKSDWSESFFALNQAPEETDGDGI